jgi:DNA recombination protein RmuC
MDSLSLTLQVLTLGFAFLAAGAALVALFRKPKVDDSIATTVRTEADRNREDNARQARELREEIRGVVKDFQAATETKLDAAAAQQMSAARDTREALAASFKETREGLTGTLAGLGEHQKERLETVSAELKALTQKQSDAANALRTEVNEAIRSLQGTTEIRLGETTERLAASFKDTREGLTNTLAGLGEHQKERLEAIATELKQLTLNEAEASEALRLKVNDTIGAFQAAIDSRLAEIADRLSFSTRETREALTGTLTGLGEHQKERLDKVLAALDLLTEKQAGAAETLRQTVETRLDKLRQENSEKLDEMRRTVDEKLQTELEKRLGDSFRTVSEQLERVYQGLGEMQSLATGVGDLKKVLSNVKTRGTLGEYQTGIQLEQFLSPEQYIVKAQVKPGTTERVDFAIRFPGQDGEGNVLLPVDAKFPSDDYQRLVDASERGDIDAMKQSADALEKCVRSCAKSIRDKYINPPTTTEIALMFLPTEALFAEVLRRPGLQDQIQREFHVTIVGPTTLASVLSAFQMGFRSLAIQKHSGEVWRTLGAVRTEFTKYGDIVGKLRDQLDTASRTIDKLGTRTNVMNRKLRDVVALPTHEAQDVLGLPAPDDETTESPE